MGEIGSFFFDTYALYELIHGNPNYRKYEKKVGLITTRLNLMELHYILLRTYGEEFADKAFNRFLKFIVQFQNDDIKKANFFKYNYKKRKLSYIDCIGYVVAKRHNFKFLTGDIQFKDMEEVEFVR